jgi:hypothetical protein
MSWISGKCLRRALPSSRFFLLAVVAVSSQRSMASLPTVTGVSPNSGPATGGTTVVITGSVLGGEVNAYFGATPATSFVNNSGTITAVSPPGVAGTVDITLFSGASFTQTNPNDQFTYIQPTPTSTPALREWSMLLLAFLLAGAGYIRLMKAAGSRTA